MFVGSSGDKALGSGVTSLLVTVLANATNFRELQLGLAIIALEATCYIVQRLYLSTSHRGFMTATDRWSGHHLALAW